MPLSPGTAYEHGVIVGKHPPYTDIRGNGGDFSPENLLGPVAEALQTHHEIAVVVNPKACQEYGSIQNHQESPPLTTRRHGLAVRLLTGQGFLKINEAVPSRWHGLAHGDWVYVPPRVSITLTGSATGGLCLEFIVATLRPKR